MDIGLIVWTAIFIAINADPQIELNNINKKRLLVINLFIKGQIYYLLFFWDIGVGRFLFL